MWGARTRFFGYSQSRATAADLAGVMSGLHRTKLAFLHRLLGMVRVFRPTARSWAGSMICPAISPFFPPPLPFYDHLSVSTRFANTTTFRFAFCPQHASGTRASNAIGDNRSQVICRNVDRVRQVSVSAMTSYVSRLTNPSSTDHTMQIWRPILPQFGANAGVAFERMSERIERVGPHQRPFAPARPRPTVAELHASPEQYASTRALQGPTQPKAHF